MDKELRGYRKLIHDGNDGEEMGCGAIENISRDREANLKRAGFVRPAPSAILIERRDCKP